jgi:hypothetical protein
VIAEMQEVAQPIVVRIVDPDGHRYDGARASSASTSSPGVVSAPIR